MSKTPCSELKRPQRQAQMENQRPASQLYVASVAWAVTQELVTAATIDTAKEMGIENLHHYDP